MRGKLRVDFCSMLPAFVFQVHPVVPVEDAVRGELEVIAWRDIGPLSVFSRGSTAMIVYTYLPDRLPAKLSPLHRINHWSGRFDGSLPSNLPISNAALSAEMNIRRERVTG